MADTNPNIPTITGAALTGRSVFVVIENTPGYLPDDSEPATFDSYDEACAYLREEAHRALAEAEEAAMLWPSGRPRPRPVLSLDRDAAGRPYSARLVDVANPHDLGRVWNVETTESDPGPVDEFARLREAEAALRTAGRDDLASAVYAAGVSLGRTPADGSVSESAETLRRLIDWSVEITEGDEDEDGPTALYAAVNVLEAAAWRGLERGPVQAAGLTMNEAAALQERAEAEGWDDPADHPDADRPPGTSGSWGEA